MSMTMSLTSCCRLWSRGRGSQSRRTRSRFCLTAIQEEEEDEEDFQPRLEVLTDPSLIHGAAPVTPNARTGGTPATAGATTPASQYPNPNQNPQVTPIQQRGGILRTPPSENNEYSVTATVARITQATAAVLREFQWQEDATGNTKVAESFRDQVTAGSLRLCVFVYMIEDSAMVNFLHSVAKYYDIESGADVNNKFVAFIGDRTKKRDPNPAILQPQNAWNWKEFDVSLDPAVAEAWYNDPNNAKTLWRQPQTTVKQWFPRMFCGGETTHTVGGASKIVSLIGDGTHRLTLENTKLVREWYLAAGQSTSATECTSAIKMDVIVIASTCEKFGDWCKKKA